MHTRIPRSPVAMLLQQVSHAIVAEMIQEFINIVVFFLGGGGGGRGATFVKDM